MNLISKFNSYTVHNSYLFLLLKLGVFGFIIVIFNHLFLIWATLKRSIQLRNDTALVSYSAATTSLLFGVLLLSITQPELLSVTSTATFSVISALIVSFKQVQRTRKPAVNA